MYVIEVRDHVMIAHSLHGEAFGPAQKMHGATFVIDVAFFRPELTDNDIVVDIVDGHVGDHVDDHVGLLSFYFPFNFLSISFQFLIIFVDLPKFLSDVRRFPHSS